MNSAHRVCNSTQAKTNAYCPIVLRSMKPIALTIALNAIKKKNAHNVRLGLSLTVNLVKLVRKIVRNVIWPDALNAFKGMSFIT